MGRLTAVFAGDLPGELALRRVLARLPARHRLPLLTWVGVYPVLTLLALVVEPLLGDASTALRTFVMSAIMVPVMVYAVMPFMKYRFDEV
ncbi:MAG: hypothetical protein AAGE18_19600 [Pseudomonadota bacterium]